MRYFTTINGKEYLAQLELQSGTARWLLNGKPVSAEMESIDEDYYLLKIDGHIYKLFLKKDTGEYEVYVDGDKFTFSLEDEKERFMKEWIKDDNQAKTIRKIQAPMPGLIIELPVNEGQEIKKGDTLAIIEAMKMENEIKAAADGTIKDVLVKEKESVDKNAVLLTIE